MAVILLISSIELDNLSNYEAETQILGSVLLDNKVMDEIHYLEERDFYTESHRIIWKLMKYKYENDDLIDLVTMVESLKTYKRLDEVGGMKYLSDMAHSVPSTAAAERYAKIIKSKAIRRRVLQAGEKISQLATEAKDEEELFNEIEELALKIRPGNNDHMLHVKEARKDFFTYLQTQDDFILTGFKKFDEWMGGLGRGWLYILAGRPSAGKTAKALQMAVGIAKSGAGEVLIWSQEMTRNQVLARMISPLAEVNGNRIRRKTLDANELEKVKKAYSQLEKLPLHIDDASGVSIDEIRSVARQIRRRQGKIGAIIVDYLGIMDIKQRNGETRAQAIGSVTRKSKQIAKELDCPFILLAQMNREGAKQGEPDLSSLKESGDIEQDADIVEFVYEDEEKSHNGKVVVGKIAKGRDVGVNKFRYLFQGWFQRYLDYE